MPYLCIPVSPFIYRSRLTSTRLLDLPPAHRSEVVVPCRPLEFCLFLCRWFLRKRRLCPPLRWSRVICALLENHHQVTPQRSPYSVSWSLMHSMIFFFRTCFFESNEYPQFMFWAETWKISDFFLSEIFHFLVVKFSVYPNRHAFVMLCKTSCLCVCVYVNVYCMPV